MDYKILEDYLNEIYHYLPLKNGKEEILSEIKSHILEKTKNEYGEITDEILKKEIENYGNPKIIAEKYLEDYHIISPAYKKYLFHYTGIFFVIHYGLIIFSAIFNYKLMLFPFFYIPVLGSHLPVWNHVILLIPMTFFYDLGIVCLFLYFVTQNEKTNKLPWIKINLTRLIKAPEKTERPKINILGLLVIGLIVLILIYLRYDTLFFLSLGWEETSGWQKMTSIFKPSVSMWLSLSVIFIYFIEILHYIIRFFAESLWIKLIKDSLILIILWLILSYPMEDGFVDFPYIDLNNIFFPLILFLTIIAGLNFLKSIIEVLKSRL